MSSLFFYSFLGICSNCRKKVQQMVNTEYNNEYPIEDKLEELTLVNIY